MLFLEGIYIYHVVHLVGANGDKEEVSFLSNSGAELGQLAIFDVLEEVAFASILVVLVESFIFWVHIHLEIPFHLIVTRSKILLVKISLLFNWLAIALHYFMVMLR